MYVKRKNGKIDGLYSHPCPDDNATESLPDNHPEIIAFRNRVPDVTERRKAIDDLPEPITKIIEAIEELAGIQSGQILIRAKSKIN